MTYQATFQRFEIKYLLNQEQRAAVLAAMQPHMAPDQFGHSTIRNIYFDTDNYRLIRRSLERPAYKEKLRLRSYCQAKADTPVFVELKKKYRSVVYKRRLDLPEKQAAECLAQGLPLPLSSQIAAEIDYFRSYYGPLRPAVFLSYERLAYYALDDSSFRVTFDENILYRQQELSLRTEPWGIPLLTPGQTLMEIKTSGGIPLWMSRILSQQRIFKASYSKYGCAYQDLLLRGQEGGQCYA